MRDKPVQAAISPAQHAKRPDPDSNQDEPFSRPPVLRSDRTFLHLITSPAAVATSPCRQISTAAPLMSFGSWLQ
jgi:hypothetical protein